MTKRLALTVAAAILCSPAGAIAASSAGVVLTVNVRHHALQLVNPRHVVQAYRFHGGLHGVGLGSRVRIKHSGEAIRQLVAKRRRARRVMFLARIVRIRGHRVVLRLSDRKVIRLRSGRLECASPRHAALVPRTIVLVTEDVKTHGIRRINCRPTSGRPGDGGRAQASGTVVGLDAGSVVVQTADGSTFRFAVDESVITSLQLSLCATVSVTYHGSGPTLVADTVQSIDAFATGECANADNGGGSGAPGQDLVGTVTQLTLDSVTIKTFGGALVSFVASLGDIDAFMIGDEVDVTYDPGGAGSLVETSIDYQDQDTVGTVASVSAGSITLVDSNHQSWTYTDDPDNQTFLGISVGDQVDVSWHLSAAGPVVDSVDDITTGG